MAKKLRREKFKLWRDPPPQKNEAWINHCVATEKPSKPSNLHVTDVWKDYMTVVWEAPQNDGGSAVTGYTLEQRDAFDVNYKFIASVDANTTQYQVCVFNG